MKTVDGKTILELEAHNVELKGDGSDMLFTVTASRQKKSGQWDRYEVRLKACRWSIQKIARQIATMHQRDRDRLTRELRRIEQEAASITHPEVKS